MTLLVQGCPGSIRLGPAPANIGLMTDILPVASDNYEEDESVVNKKRSRQTYSVRRNTEGRLRPVLPQAGAAEDLPGKQSISYQLQLNSQLNTG